jgi:outer membrane lipoprotein-sorting protein
MKDCWVVPKGETTPMPDTATARDTRVRYHVFMSTGRCWMRVWSVFALILTALAVQLAAQGTAADTSFDALYRRGRQLNAELKTLTANFTETTTSQLLTRPLLATGTIAVERPSRVVLHYQEPEQRDVLIEGDRLTVSWPARHIREVTNITTTNRRIQRYFVDTSPDELRENFTISIRIGADRRRTHQLTMVPRRKQIREGLASLDLWIDDASLLLSAMKMTFPNGDTKLMVLDKLVTNQPIDPSLFSAAK